MAPICLLTYINVHKIFSHTFELSRFYRNHNNNAFVPQDNFLYNYYNGCIEANWCCRLLIIAIVTVNSTRQKYVRCLVRYYSYKWFKTLGYMLLSHNCIPLWNVTLTTCLFLLLVTIPWRLTFILKRCNLFLHHPEGIGE